MITLDDYLKDPCGSLSIPLWKWRQTVVPDTMKIIHHRDFTSAGAWMDEPYFRLKHDLEAILAVRPDSYSVRTAQIGEISLFVRIINESYEYLSVTEKQLFSYTRHRVYDPSLWLVAENSVGEPAGCIIGELDRETREGILEWVQVLPRHRRKGVGQLLVSETLKRMVGRADFATVSGRCNDAANPEGLYRRCGFTGTDIWHILSK